MLPFVVRNQAHVTRLITLACLLIAADASAQSPPVTVAMIDGEPITAAEVERELAAAYPNRKLEGSERLALLARARDQVIDRRLALRRLARQGEAATSADVDHALARLEKQVTDQGQNLAEHYERLGITRDAVRQTLLWQLSWQAYLARHLTDDNLAKYFERNRRDFDGTELKVAHILLKADGDDSAARALATKEAEALRAQITGSKLSFADAARQHSSGPSAKAGGDIGWIARREPMPETFSAAAFALKPGDVSPPVETTFGIHLIQVLEVKPGTKTWQEAADRLKPAATLFLFRRLAEQERMTTKVERMESWP
jgi:parvulin-like peptidyl-prolyl isomerase